MSRRLQKEFQNVIEKFDAEVIDESLFHWKITLHGPQDTPYFGGTFLVQISFTEKYPFEPPSISFETKIYHPNIDHKGIPCIAILKDDWSATCTILQVLQILQDLLVNPNVDNPLNVEAANLYKTNRNEYVKKVIEITKTYAI